MDAGMHLGLTGPGDRTEVQVGIDVLHAELAHAQWALKYLGARTREGSAQITDHDRLFRPGYIRRGIPDALQHVTVGQLLLFAVDWKDPGGVSSPVPNIRRGLGRPFVVLRHILC
jgi:hypothetical protein